jgi:predicted DNA-binding transcriptional regulator AlpA
MTIDPLNERLLGTPQTCAVLGTNRNGLHELMQLPDFPKPMRFEPNNQKSRLRFRLTEVLAWVARQQALTTAAKAATGQPSQEATR